MRRALPKSLSGSSLAKSIGTTAPSVVIADAMIEPPRAKSAARDLKKRSSNRLSRRGGIVVACRGGGTCCGGGALWLWSPVVVGVREMDDVVNAHADDEGERERLDNAEGDAKEVHRACAEQTRCDGLAACARSARDVGK